MAAPMQGISTSSQAPIKPSQTLSVERQCAMVISNSHLAACDVPDLFGKVSLAEAFSPSTSLWSWRCSFCAGYCTWHQDPALHLPLLASRLYQHTFISSLSLTSSHPPQLSPPALGHHGAMKWLALMYTRGR